LVKGRNPVRAVIDQKLTLPKTLHLFDNSARTFVYNDVLTDIKDKTLYISIEDFEHFLPQYILFQLYLQDIQSVIIEGGTKTLQTFIDANLWDEARIFTANQIWGEGKKAPNLKGDLISEDKVGEDLLTILTPKDL
jgi:diaminohydroxyphosphoribosylaminopyrimidine deaminase/5-amino-6-(5-phosphoribosylamino)uracil reductase